MRESVAHLSQSAHPVIPDMRPTMAKAGIRKADIREIPSDFRVRVGGAIQRALSLLGWTLDRLSIETNVDARQLGRWINGTDRPHFDRLFAVEEMRQPLVVALAEVAGEHVEIETTIRVRRSA